MTHLKSASAGALAVVLACTGVASADVTAEQVWAAWKDLAERSGQTLSGTESETGDTLTIREARLVNASTEGASTSLALGTLVLSERSDGSVAVMFPDAMPLRVVAVSDTGERIEMDMTVRQSGLEMTASGDTGTIAYDMAAPDLALRLDMMKVDGTPKDVTLEMAAMDTAGTYVVSGNEAQQVAADFTTKLATLAMAVTDAAQGIALTMTGKVGDVTSSSVSTVPAGAEGTTPAGMLAAGLSSKGRVMHGGLSYAMDTAEQDNRTNIAVTSGPGTLDFALAEGAMAYDVVATDTKMAVSGTQIPLPQIEMEVAESAFRLEMPLLRTDEPADFALLTRLDGLKIDNAIWAMFDPTGQLPRDPATVVLDLGGKARWLVDITDADSVQPTEMPGELSALNVKDLQLSVAGVDLAGQGAFTFDNSQKIGQQGMPQPEGKLALRLAGGNALLDKLVGMGLLPRDQATGIRMMVGMFARPGAEGDTLISDIEVTGDGKILANGQRLR
ncbi:hypothetical protein RGUI_3286 [Rhodovulum sp. P5]|uniref:DUF2125 domain-containing protein n=1 Tax=Rhodovulum sp. P5 TaxID=1564506 RepID=UPI0009C272C3|nr:DUF2125 domain-containing protein [Rhodovulum sp. P5]ARE41427.1 hypothetical protein RGUI_3286 [Rhodovulum sp. P5]